MQLSVNNCADAKIYFSLNIDRVIGKIKRGTPETLNAVEKKNRILFISGRIVAKRLSS